MKTIKSLLIIVTLLFLTTSCLKKDEFIINNTYGVNQYDLYKSIVQVNTTNVATGFETVFSDMITDSAERAHLCQAFVDPVRFLADESGYFFVESNDAWMIAHPNKPELVGTYRMDVEDIHGKQYVKEMVNTIKYIGYGFVEYYFENPVTHMDEPKHTFVKGIPSAGFWMGAGFYGASRDLLYTANDASTIVVMQTTRSFAEGIGGVFEDYYSDSTERVEFCRKLIDHVRFFDDQSGYFFIYDFDCVNVAHGTQKDLQGQDLYNYQDSHGNYVIRDLVAIAEEFGEGFYEYWWNNPNTGKEEPKIAWIKKIPGIDYFIGSGIYFN